MGSVRSLDSPEDFAQLYLRQAAAQVIENTGFSHCNESALNLISDLARRFMEKLWTDGKIFAEHAGRLEPSLQDAHMVFQKLQLRTTEMSDYMRQVASHPLNHKVPRFPASKTLSRSIYGSVSERELAERPEHIPPYFPAVHPEWCSDHVVSTEGNSTNPPSVADVAMTSKRGSAMLNVNPGKSRVPFPDFTGMTAKALGLVRQKRTSMASFNKVTSEPSGISSSANISSAQLNVSPSTSHSSKSKHKKALSAPKTVIKPTLFTKPSVSTPVEPVVVVNDPVVISEPKSVEEKLSEDGSESPAVRVSGMFGMPPSSAVCNDNSYKEAEKIKKKKKKDREGMVKVKEKKEKLKEREKDKEADKDKSKDKEKEALHDKVHQDPSTSSNEPFLNDDTPLSLFSFARFRQVLTDDNVGFVSSAMVSSQSDLDEKPCPILTPVLPQKISLPPNSVKDETSSKPPNLVQQASKPKKELKKEKSEKVKLKVKSVEIVPSDDSDSDNPCERVLNTVSAASCRSSAMKNELESKHGWKSNVKAEVYNFLRTSVAEKKLEREESGLQQNKDDFNGRSKPLPSNNIIDRNGVETVLTSKPSIPCSSTSTTEVLRIKTENEELPMPNSKEEEVPIKMIFSRSLGKNEFSAFSPTDLKPQQQNVSSTVAKQELVAQRSQDVSGIETPVTIKLDAREELLRKEKKKKHKKEKDRDHADKDDGHHHHHHHKKKDRKKDKEHKKEKRLLNDVTGDTEESRQAKKRKADLEPANQPELKIPKLKIKIGSANTDSVRSPPELCSQVASAPVSVISKEIGKINNKYPGQEQLSQNCATVEKIHIPIKERVGSDPMNKAVNYSSLKDFKDVQSYSKSKDIAKEPRRLQCVTKAELKVVPKASKKAELPLFSSKTDARREEPFLPKEKAIKTDDKPLEKQRFDSKKDERKKDRDKEIEKEKDSIRENGRVHDVEKERLKDCTKKDAVKDTVRLKEKDRKEKMERDKAKDSESKKDLFKSKKDFTSEKDRKRQDNTSLTELFGERPQLKSSEKEGCNEKANIIRETKISRNNTILGVQKKKKSLATTSGKTENNNGTSKNVIKTPKEKRNFIADDDDVWICPECSVAYVDGATDMVCCDGCDNWFHWSCVGLLVAPPENTNWYCQGCLKKKSLKRASIPGKIGNAIKKPKKSSVVK